MRPKDDEGGDEDEGEIVSNVQGEDESETPRGKAGDDYEVEDEEGNNMHEDKKQDYGFG